jgi:hypothetical protein
MLSYPQLVSGALSQFPIVRRRQVRTIVNEAADGSSLKLGDPGGASLEWALQYSGISDKELGALAAFFTAAEGSLNSFTFLDPCANLLAASEVLNDSAWSPGPMLHLQGGSGDPLGGAGAWTIQNIGGGPQSLTQTINAPGDYTYCFSVYVKSTEPADVVLIAGENRVSISAGRDWTRAAIVGSGAAKGNSVDVGIEVPASATLAIFGPQAEVQLAPSAYKTSSLGGVYSEARFRDDGFSFTSDGVNRNSATVNIYYANHL